MAEVYRITVTVEEVNVHDPASMSVARDLHESFFDEAVAGVERMGHGLDKVVAHKILQQADRAISTITEREVELSKLLPLP